MTTRLHLRRRDRSRGDFGTLDLAELSTAAIAAILGKGDGSLEVREGAERLVATMETATRTLAERTHAEFTAAMGWTVEQRQMHSLRAIVEHVQEMTVILDGTGLGLEVEDAITALLRETYFARLTEVAQGAQARPGIA